MEHPHDGPDRSTTQPDIATIEDEKAAFASNAVDPRQLSLSWSDITYDIPLSKKKRKALASQKEEHSQGDVEKGLAEHDAAAAAVASTPASGVPPLAPTDRRILSGVSGSVNKGEMVAILGASGAGKTTLLNILSARLSSVGTLHGKVLFHNRPRDPDSWKRTVGFVEQEDMMLGHLTVEETLAYAARLRLPDKLYTRDQKAQRVQDTIDMLRLQTCKDTRIGSSNTRGVSGGERKRTSIGTVSGKIRKGQSSNRFLTWISTRNLSAMSRCSCSMSQPLVWMPMLPTPSSSISVAPRSSADCPVS